MKKTKVLFIVSEFYQSGTARFTYEIDCALNKELFETSILSLNPLNNSNQWQDYYNFLHEEIGTEIHFIDDINNVVRPTVKERILRKFFGQELPDVSRNVVEFLDNFDAISVMGEYNYNYVKRYLMSHHREKLFIHPVNSLYQKPDNYIAFEKELHFNIVSGFLEQDLDFEFGGFSSYSHTFIPLCFMLKNKIPLWIPPQNEVKKIGLFSRIGKTKPIDPFIYSFQILKEIIPNVELHIFGSGNPDEEGVMRYVKQLDMKGFVIFRGHQKDMLDTAMNEDLDLVWLHGYHGLPGGWAGYDICHLGIPQVFWDFGGTRRPELRETFPMSNSVSEMASLSLKFLIDKERAKKLRDLQFTYTEKNQNINNFIHNLEKAYQSVVNK